jgi:PPOX class probable F420-dependent enzyme
MPGYGVPESLDGALPWSWAHERLQSSRNYWVCTTRPDGRPHAMAVWGALVGNDLYFSTADGSVKARNLDGDPRCTICTERADEAVVLEGRAERAKDRGAMEKFAERYRAKYDFPLDLEAPPGPIWLVKPAKVFAFIEHESQFSRTATRWTFEDGD